MGVNIHVDAEGWDSCANAGMKKILWDNEMFPKTVRPDDPDRDPDDYDRDFRPSDFTLWRESIIQLDCNTEMWLRGLDALEANPESWVSYSH